MGSRTCVYYIIDEEAHRLETGKYNNTRDDAAAFTKRVASEYDCEAVFESTGNYSYKTQLALEKHHIPFQVANPIRLKLAQSGIKTDKLDSERLANRLRLDEIPQSHPYSPEARYLLDTLRDRINYIKHKIILTNRQHAILAKYDFTLPGVETSGIKCQNYLDKLNLDRGDKRNMTLLVQDVRHANEQIYILESVVSKEALDNPDARFIMTMPGFEAFSALMVAASINGISRFRNAKKLVSFMGLCPRVYQSGNTTRHGRMKKAADRNLTAVMMHSAFVAVQNDLRWKAKYENLKKRHPPVVALSHIHCNLYMAYADAKRTIQIPQQNCL